MRGSDVRGRLAGGILLGALLSLAVFAIRPSVVPRPENPMGTGNIPVTLTQTTPPVHSSEPATNQSLNAPSAADSKEANGERSETSRRFPVTIQRPAGPPRVATGQHDFLGNPVTVSCASCHANLPAQPETRSGEALTEFHQGLQFQHGQLSCLTCHHAEDYNRLRLADGSFLDYPQVQTLCSQCHVPQARDYEQGAHGGMVGYWDLTRGPRQRKGCIDCHDPHAPAFPRMIPEFKSRDRFLGRDHQKVDHE